MVDRSCRLLAFWKTAVPDKLDFVDELVAALHERAIRYCVIGRRL